MLLSYKYTPTSIYINILLESVKVDINRTQTKNKTVQRYSNDKIQC